MVNCHCNPKSLNKFLFEISKVEISFSLKSQKLKKVFLQNSKSWKKFFFEILKVEISGKESIPVMDATILDGDFQTKPQFDQKGSNNLTFLTNNSILNFLVQKYSKNITF